MSGNGDDTTATGATAAAALAELMERGLSQNPELSAKQARLLNILAAGAPATDDLNRPETEGDGLRAGELRILKARRYLDSLRHPVGDETRASAKKTVSD